MCGMDAGDNSKMVCLLNPHAVFCATTIQYTISRIECKNDLNTIENHVIRVHHASVDKESGRSEGERISIPSLARV